MYLNELFEAEQVPHGGDMNFMSKKHNRSDAYIRQAFGNSVGRDLDVRGRPMTIDEWEPLMVDACGYGGRYNEFDAKKVAHWFKQTFDDFELDHMRFIPGREGSVAMYLMMADQDELKRVVSIIKHQKYGMEPRPDEIHIHKSPSKSYTKEKLIRLWWD